MQMKVSWCRRVDLPGVILVFSEISNALLTRTRSAALKQLNSCPLPSFLFRSPQRSAPLCVCFLAGVSSPTTPETRDASSRKFLLKLFFFFNKICRVGTTQQLPFALIPVQIYHGVLVPHAVYAGLGVPHHGCGRCGRCGGGTRDPRRLCR